MKGPLVGEVASARDWENVEGKRFVVREYFLSDTWGPVAWVTEWQLGCRGVPISRVIPAHLLSLDPGATQERREWIADDDEREPEEKLEEEEP